MLQCSKVCSTEMGSHLSQVTVTTILNVLGGLGRERFG